ncbi:hypothetical protein [Desulfosporosinus sp. BICA1-9]|uniref:hypothetical protein n=1 Tax=Desulfosporosinus sp. BICA1-9 TaxID=1531958 RepID=UPI00054C3793|nr:hypothetical protein [Desulfosporosinus sp. BICA1-9]KJS49028.1 MAG: hypothetical protein VR66_10800 [Peptococcaceae bacterium BRH_c23]KJS90758.1 MAG: hypothetical protein JL57_00095 [Desulfosporosinus sp. BICA1-9]HBW35504.1 hypothetical protein [Desulfosporosinus sp.]
MLRTSHSVAGEPLQNNTVLWILACHFVDLRVRLYIGAEDATLYQGMGLLARLIPRPIEASDVGSHVKSTPEWFALREGGSGFAGAVLTQSVALSKHIIQLNKCHK